MKSFSRRFSRGDRKLKAIEPPKKSISDPVRHELYDAPVPNQTRMTVSQLFQPANSSSTQATAMDRTLYEIPQPSQVDAMTDHIKDHVSGELFPYVGVVGNEGETPDARRARMLALKPSYGRRDVPQIKVEGCPLISREGGFTMDQLLKFAKTNVDVIPSTGPVPSGVHSPDYTMSKPYVHIRQVTILYTPNVSSTSNYCNLWMNLIDNRLIDADRGSQTNVVVSGQEGIMEMSCDYCVSRVDLLSFSLTYSLERDIVHPGNQWGTASFYFSISESDLPYQSSKVDAMGVYRMPITTLLERKTNADKSDISFTPADLVRLRSLYKQGDIVDVDQPQTARLKTNVYSKTSMRAEAKGKAIDTKNKPGWEFMDGAKAAQVDAFEASVDPDDDSEVPKQEVNMDEVNRRRKETLKAYMTKQEEDRSKIVELKDDEDEGGNEVKAEKEVVEESSSREQEINRALGAGKRGKKNVGFPTGAV